MSSLCAKVERAMWSALRARFAQYAEDSATLLAESGGTLVVTDTGLYIRVTDGTTVDIPVHVGQRADEENAEADIAIVCESADEDWTGSGNYTTEANIFVRYPADGTDATPDMVEALNTVSDIVSEVIKDEGLAAEMSYHEEN